MGLPISDQDFEPVTIPERGMWVAVVDRAVQDIYGINVPRSSSKSGRTNLPKLKRDAHDWLTSKSKEQGSIRWIDYHFNLDKYQKIRVANAVSYYRDTSDLAA